MSELRIISGETIPVEHEPDTVDPRNLIAVGGAAVAAYEPSEPDTDMLSDHIPLQVQRVASSENQRGPVLAATEKSLSDDLFKLYLREIGKTPLLDAAKEVELSRRIEAGLYAGRLVLRLRGNVKQPTTQKDEEAAALEERALANLKKATGSKTKIELRDKLLEVEADGAAAKEQMIKANLRLVVSVAKRYTGKGLSLLDLTQEGSLGLIRAVEKFDYAKGYKFSTYGTWWIRQAITRAIADQARTIRIPVHMVEKINRLEGIERRLIVDLGREPTESEVGAAMEMEREEIRELMRIRRIPISLSRSLGDGGGRGPGEKDAEFGDLIEDVDATDEAYHSASYSLLAEALEGHLDTLSEREQQIMRLRYGLVDGRQWTLERIGKELGLTRERIRQLEKKAIDRLRQTTKGSGLRDYLPD